MLAAGKGHRDVVAFLLKKFPDLIKGIEVAPRI
jgi:hypothetical protein